MSKNQQCLLVLALSKFSIDGASNPDPDIASSDALQTP
jgi:hypothetical protein